MRRERPPTIGFAVLLNVPDRVEAEIMVKVFVAGGRGRARVLSKQRADGIIMMDVLLMNYLAHLTGIIMNVHQVVGNLRITVLCNTSIHNIENLHDTTIGDFPCAEGSGVNVERRCPAVVSANVRRILECLADPKTSQSTSPPSMIE